MPILQNLIATLALSLMCLPTWAAIQIAPQVRYADGVQAASSPCAWESRAIDEALARAKGALAPQTPGDGNAGQTLSFQVLQFKQQRSGKGGDYEVRVRGDVSQDGKLLATRDFIADESFKSEDKACPALIDIAKAIGEDAADWIVKTRFMECGPGCAGIHPDESIVLADTIQLARPEAINEALSEACGWPAAMLGKLIKAFNTTEPAPRAKLEARAIDLQTYRGRRLILRVHDVHALGGGGFSGPKWMELSGELRDGDSLVASFRSRSTSGRGMSNCGSLAALSDDSAKMIADWLSSPTLDAALK